jgi:carboxylesterase
VRPAPETEPYSAPAAPGSGTGVLLCHGFTGSPASLRPWAEFLNDQGYAVSVPRLPGHGTTWQEMNRTTYADWYAEAERAFEKLRAECDHVFVTGLSMGGCLALQLAADRGTDVAGMVLVNPSVATQRRDVKLLPVLKRVVPSFPGISNDIRKPGVHEHAYSRVPLKAAHSMFTAMRAMRERLAEVTQPLLIYRSAVDHVVDPSSGRLIMARVSSRDLEERVLQGSYHVATLDHDAPEIFAGSAAFVRRVSGGG